MSSVLVVDDDPDILESVKAVLELSVEGLEVRVAPSGMMGLDALRAGRVDLIITDLRMPGMNGAEFLSRAEPLAPGVPHVVISAFPESVVRGELASARVDSILPKPMDVDALIHLTRRLLAAA